MEIRGVLFCFFFQAEDGIRDVAVTGVQTCALPICEFTEPYAIMEQALAEAGKAGVFGDLRIHLHRGAGAYIDRKSTRLNSSHGYISYAVFCLKKKKINIASGCRASGYLDGTLESPCSNS